VRDPKVNIALRMRNGVNSSRGGTGPGLDSGRILRFSFGPGVKNLGKTRSGLESLFNLGSSRSLRGHLLSKNMGKLRLYR